MQFSDLHIHSTFSDGNKRPVEIIEIANTNNINCISITDHDTIDSQYCIENYFSKSKPLIVPGVEISTEFENKEIHILGYFIDIYNTDLISKLNLVKAARVERILETINVLNLMNLNITESDIDFDKYNSIGRPHIAKILVDKGYSTSIKTAFNQYLTRGKPAFIERFKLNYKDALELIYKSNGISVLAHPGEIYKGITLDSLIKDLKVYGLNGIEVFHPSHTDSEINKYYNIAKKYKLLITGGSDYHGTSSERELNIGSVGIDENLTRKFIEHYQRLKYKKN